MQKSMYNKSSLGLPPPQKLRLWHTWKCKELISDMGEVSLSHHNTHIFWVAAFAKPLVSKAQVPDILHFCFSMKIKGNLSVSFLMHLKCDRKVSVPFISVTSHFPIIAPLTVILCLTRCGLAPLFFTQGMVWEWMTSEMLYGLDTSLMLVFLLPCCRTCCPNNPVLLSGLFTCDHYVIIYFIESH